ncbi:unnamed protein product [Umbelopsis ramanniana]
MPLDIGSNRNEQQASEKDQPMNKMTVGSNLGGDTDTENDDKVRWFDAASSGDISNIENLLLHGADINWNDDQKRTALHICAGYGHKELVSMLLNLGALADSKDKNSSTEVVQLLLNHSTAIDSQDIDSATPLHIASINGHAEVVQILINRGAAIDSKNKYLATPLHLAAWKGHEEVVQLLLQHGAAIDSQNEDAHTPLHRASAVGHTDVVRLLIDNSAVIDSNNKYLITPLNLASMNGHTEVVQLLIDRGAVIDSRREDLQTPLHHAAWSGHTDVVRLLIDNGAAIDSQDENSATPLHLASEDGHTDVVKLLINNGAVIDSNKKYLNTPLHLAAWKGHKEVVHLLLQHGAAIDSQNKSAYTPLHRASENGHTDLVRLLIDSGAAINSQNEDAHTPLHLASINGHIHVVHLLIDNNAAIDLKSEHLETPLYFAAWKGHIEVVQLLLQHGAAIDSQNKYAYTPLHRASENEHTDVVKLLINNGAAIELKSEDLETPLHFAASEGHTEVVQALLQHGAAIDSQNKDGQTPLHLASMNGHKNVVKLLIDTGVTVDAKNKNSRTTLHQAAMSGHIDVASRLLDSRSHTDQQAANTMYIETELLEDDGVQMLHLELGQVADMEALNIMNESPLIVATKASQLNVISLLISKGAKLEATDKDSLTALHWAAVNGECAILDLLLKQGACIDAKTKHGNTALHLAAEFSHPEIMTMLINYGANKDVKNEDGNTPMKTAILKCNLAIAYQLKDAGETPGSSEDSQLLLLYTVVDAGYVGLVKEALDMIADAEERRHYMDRLLLRAPQSGRLDVVSYLLDSGADIKVCDDDGLSVIFLAGQHPDLLSMLIHREALIMARNNRDQNQTTIHYFAAVGQIEALKTLLNCGCDIHSTDNSNNTALHYAAKQQNCNVAALLVEQGIDVNAKNDEGETALHSAIKNGFVELASMLIDSNIDIEAKTFSLGSTALHIAVKKDDLKLIKLMLGRAADVNSKNTAGETALHLATKDRLLNVCALLIKHGANVNSKDRLRHCPLEYAVADLQPSMVRLFLDHGASVDQQFTEINPVVIAISSANAKFGSFDFNKNNLFEVMELLVQAGDEINRIPLTEEWKTRFPKLEGILDRLPDRFMKMERKMLNEFTAIVHDHIEAINPIEFKLRRVVNSTVNEQASDERWLNHTKHKYGYGFPMSKAFLLDELKDLNNNQVKLLGNGSGIHSLKIYGKITIDERAPTVMQILFDSLDAKLFKSNHFFMLELNRCADAMPPKWASYFDKMKGIIREPGRLIVKIPPKDASLPAPARTENGHPYLQFIDAVYTCRRASNLLDEEAFADILGGSEISLATDLHAVLIAGLSILSIAGGDGLIEKLVAAILGTDTDIEETSFDNGVYADWKIRNRRQCIYSKTSIHRPLSPVAAAKAVGIDIWRERHKQIVTRVWDLKQDKLVNYVDARDVVFITHKWGKDEASYEHVKEIKWWLGKTISGMSEKLRRVRKTLLNHATYVWMDTICIDKSNLSELDEAIRSMYKWYASSAAVVLDSGTPLKEWCKRGWCLQEGAAAGLLCGISEKGALATIQELAKEQGYDDLCTLDLHLNYRQGNAAEILARMAVRETTREEDMDYALTGIFSIHLTLAYGEGPKSRKRLLQQLAIENGDLSFLSFQSFPAILPNYLPSVKETIYTIAVCERASVPIIVSHFGMCFQVQLIKGQDVKPVLQRLKDWKDFTFANGRFLGAVALIEAADRAENSSKSSSADLAIIHEIKSIMLLQSYDVLAEGYDADGRAGGTRPIRLCYRLQCCQIEENEFERLFDKTNAKLENIWLGDKPNGVGKKKRKLKSVISLLEEEEAEEKQKEEETGLQKNKTHPTSERERTNDIPISASKV